MAKSYYLDWDNAEHRHKKEEAGYPRGTFISPVFTETYCSGRLRDMFNKDKVPELCTVPCLFPNGDWHPVSVKFIKIK